MFSNLSHFTNLSQDGNVPYNHSYFFRVVINKADWPEFAELPELGETLARRIVDSRAAAGPFGDHDYLLRVNGIGPRTLEQLKPYLLPMPDQEDVAGDAKQAPNAL